MDVLGCLYSDVERHREQHVQAVQWSTNTAQQAEEAKAERRGWQKDTFWALWSLSAVRALGFVLQRVAAVCREPVRFALCLNQCPNNRREPDGWCQHGGRRPVQTAIPASPLHFATTHLALAHNDLVKPHAG